MDPAGFAKPRGTRKQMTAYVTQIRPSADKTAISLSLLCALHCLATPVLITVLPSAIALRLENEIFHLWMLIAVVPISLFALTLGCREHRNLGVAGSGTMGIALMCVAIMLGDDLLGPFSERALTLLGAGLVTGSHVRNFIICRQSNICDC